MPLFLSLQGEDQGGNEFGQVKENQGIERTAINLNSCPQINTD
jgi:hypothetical protein